jgi:hypothetical protein
MLPTLLRLHVSGAMAFRLQPLNDVDIVGVITQAVVVVIVEVVEQRRCTPRKIIRIDLLISNTRFADIMLLLLVVAVVSKVVVVLLRSTSYVERSKVIDRSTASR